MQYQGGLMSTWNKFCFTGGILETSVMLPGFNNVAGLWPAVWTLGNLGELRGPRAVTFILLLVMWKHLLIYH